MAWEPWFKASVPEEPPHDPDDPRLLVNVFKNDPEQPEPEAVKQWVADLIYAPSK